MNDRLNRVLDYLKNFDVQTHPVSFQSVPDGRVPTESFDYHVHKYWEVKFCSDPGELIIQAPQTVHCATRTDHVFAVTHNYVQLEEWFFDLSDDKNIYNFLPELLDNLSRMPLRSEFNTMRTHLVEAVVSNLPSGLKAKNIKYTIDHKTVTVVGPPEVIAKMSSATLSTIDFTMVSSSSGKFEVSLVLPDGVKLLDNIEVFLVTIDTSGYKEKTVAVSDIRFKGLASSVKANVGKTIKNVKICGPEEVIKKIKASDLYATVDLTDRTAGEYTVDARIASTKYNNVWQVGTYSVAVTIK